MARTRLTIVALLSLLVVSQTAWAQSTHRVVSNDATQLSADSIIAALKAGTPAEKAYITYIATLVSQQRLPQKIVVGSFRWAQKKPLPYRAQYFVRAVIQQAAKVGIDLPNDTPSLTGSIAGKTVVKVLGFDVPAPNIVVTIEGTDFATRSNTQGYFAFRGVPYGEYVLKATGPVVLIPHQGISNKIYLPSAPPSDEPAEVKIVLRPLATDS